MKSRFDELLPWYANGTLGADERLEVERYLAEHPKARAELDWYRSLATRLHDDAPAVPETIGLAKVLARIDGDKPGWRVRFAAFFDALGMRPGVALAGLAVIATQAGFIAHLVGEREDDASQVRASRAVPADEGPLLKINFAPEAREPDIRHALIAAQGRIVGGPGQLGDYFVAVPAGKEASVAEQLKANPMVQSVSLAPGLPPRQ